ncbi:MAG: hypothetical protein FWF15_01730 [Oscillospiraceae bacterium]|nr:hypothetical protein [Oscillospiraceae bacterium]
MKFKLLVLLLFILVLISCGQSENIQKGDITTTNSTDTQTDAVVNLQPEIKNFGGYDFRFHSAVNDDNRLFVVEEMNGDTINDAVYLRNRAVEEKYNISISVVKLADTASQVSAVSKNVQADDDFGDIAMIRLHSFFTLAQEGYFYNWYDYDEVRLDKPWWDQRISDDLKIKNKLYTINGDFTTLDKLGTMVVMYNKKLYTDYEFENIYNIVTEGRWIFDRFWKMVVTTSKDLNGDGKMDKDDQFGILTEYSSLYYFYSGGGYRSIQLKADGSYEIAIGTEKAVNIIEKILVLGTEKDKYSLIADDGKVPGIYDTSKGMFRSDQGLFLAGTFNAVTTFRDMQSDYSVLPIPKYDEIQKEYYCLVTWNDQPAAMPITIKDPNRTALIMEAIGYESGSGMREAFYDTFLVGKLIRDEETVGMLDLIFASKTYDLDWYAGISGLLTILNNIGKSGNNNFVSEYAKIELQAQAKLEAFLNDFK